MKSGICPKCNSVEVFRRNFPGGYRSSLAITFESSIRLEDYVCVTCGYVESYLEDLNKIYKIKKHCSHVAPQQTDRSN